MAPFEVADEPGTVTVYRHGSIYTSYAPAEDTDLARGVALRTALADAQPWDELQLDATTYDMGGLEHIEFPARVSVLGAGKESTRITSSVPQGIDGAATFTLNNLTVIEDCWLEGSLLNGAYQPLVGMQETPDENVTTYLRRVKITGDSDGLFVWTNPIYSYTIYGYDLEISTRYDAIASLGSGSNPQTIKLYNSTITVAQPSTIPEHSSNAVNVRSGFVGLYDCTINVTGDGDSVQTLGIWCYNVGSALVENCTFNVSAPTGMTYDFLVQDGTEVTVIDGQGSGPDGTYTSFNGAEVYAAAPSTVVNGRRIFYNNSAFDDTNPRANLLDAGAIAIDKFALLPGDGLAELGTVTSYSKGLNGLRISMSNVRSSLSVDDFVFKVGNDNDPANWLPAPAPLSVTMVGNANVSGPHFVDIIWADGAIANTWLEVQVLPTASTGLVAADVFYFGNRIGETGNPTATHFTTTVSGDAMSILADGLGPAIGIADVRDIDRSNVITVSGDRAAIVDNIGALLRIDIALGEESESTLADGGVASALSISVNGSRVPRGRRAAFDPGARGGNPLSAARSAVFRDLSAAAWSDGAAISTNDPSGDAADDELEALFAALARMSAARA